MVDLLLPQHTLAFIAEGKIYRSRNLFANCCDFIDTLADRLCGCVCQKQTMGEYPIFVQQAQEEVLRLNVRRPVLRGFISSEEYRPPRLFWFFNCDAIDQYCLSGSISLNAIARLLSCELAGR
jgi:hypothetical protein